MKKPIPTDTAVFICFGIALKIASLTLVKESTMKIKPSNNTAVNAACQSYPIEPQIVYAKYAFNPRPADNANGIFENAAIAKQAIAEATAVAVRIAPASIPDALKIDGFRAKM